jgi:hypothetical protein
MDMALDRDGLHEILARLGDALRRPATICLFGSAPGIANGQPDRQTEDIDVWRPASNYDEADLRQACAAAGVRFDPKEAIEPGAIYLQIVRPGIVNFPPMFDTELLGCYGSLTVVMPRPELLAAMKLIRADARDIDDVVWWVKERALASEEIREAVAKIPNPAQREAAEENLVFVRLVGGDRPK